jgi:Kef-type K+ transport system membrane component KefB
VSDPILFTLFIIFTGAALAATVGLFTRQSLLLVYILVGVIAGPGGFGWVAEPELVSRLSEVGVLFLLFLLGLNLFPQRLFGMLRKAMLVTVASSVAFGGVAVAQAQLLGFTLNEALVMGAAAMFSSTIVTLKLMPTLELHQQHAGGVIIAVLLLQDLLAILILVLLQAMGGGEFLPALLRLGIALPALGLVAIGGARWVLLPLFERFDTIREYLFLMALGWCLGMAQLAGALNLPPEVGAFIGGVALATHPVSAYIAESLKPLRDFFLVMFFFSLGAGFDVTLAGQVWLPAMLFTVLLLVAKPLVFRVLLGVSAETAGLSWEVGVRLGQLSEFSLFIAFMAAKADLISAQASTTIQIATIASFFISSYVVMWLYPTPIAVSARLRQE